MTFSLCTLLGLFFGVELQDAPVSEKEVAEKEESVWIELPSSLAFGVTADLIGEFATRRNFDRYNTIRARSLQMQAAGDLGTAGRAYAVLDVADGGDGQDLILREAAAWVDTLPAGFAVRAGKFFADLGAWNTVYVNEFAAPNLDTPRLSYFGGQVVSSGLEVHHEFTLGDLQARWSVGVAADIENHDVNLPGNGLEEDLRGLLPPGRRGIRNYAGTARLEVRSPLSDYAYLQFGASAYHSPDAVSFRVVDPDGIPNNRDDRLQRNELAQLNYGLDFTYVSDPDYNERSEIASVEFWYDNSEFQRSSGRTSSDPALGLWGLYEIRLDRHWAVGAVASWAQAPMDLRGDESASQSVFANYFFGAQSRVRVFATRNDNGDGEPKFFVLGAQLLWTFGGPREGQIHGLRQR